ncbi:MAG: hypothetical protein KDD10_11870 [Phaeodactylibacter sp.]|nr:hypothetical protein [Phaeodactylibacter sp.]MCB9291744.1 hypothetical protein [Lewinellaceae bacterium]
MPTPLAQLSKNWKKLLADNKWKALFDDMQEHLQGEPASHVVLLASRHQSAYQNLMLGTISSADAEVVFNQVRQALLYLIDNLTESGLGAGGPDADGLDTLVRQLEVGIPLTPLHLVNCDRYQSLKVFQECFEGWRLAPCRFQFYYLLACPNQRPQSFAERLVYELAGAYATSHLHSIEYQRSAGNARVKTELLPLGGTADDAKDNFKKYFAERFRLGNTSFEDYLRTGLPRLQWEYVITSLSVTAGDWYSKSSIVEEYLQWLMDSFAEAEGNTPTFLFFFVIWLENAHLPEKLSRRGQETVESIKGLVEKNRHHATLITPLPPVPALDLKEWLQVVTLGHIKAEQKNAIIDAIAARLQGEELERFQKENVLNMEHIEGLQEMVCNHSWRDHPDRRP